MKKVAQTHFLANNPLKLDEGLLSLNKTAAEISYLSMSLKICRLGHVK